jgi:hypothetical protein
MCRELDEIIRTVPLRISAYVGMDRIRFIIIMMMMMFLSMEGDGYANAAEIT